MPLCTHTRHARAYIHQCATCKRAHNLSPIYVQQVLKMGVCEQLKTRACLLSNVRSNQMVLNSPTRLSLLCTVSLYIKIFVFQMSPALSLAHSLAHLLALARALAHVCTPSLHPHSTHLHTYSHFQPRHSHTSKHVRAHEQTLRSICRMFPITQAQEY